MIPDGFLHELLSRVDIVDVVGRRVELKRSGANHMGLCPFHAEKSPSFSVNAAKQFYHCFGCGAHGDVIRFLMEHSGASFRDAVAELAQPLGMAVPDESLDPAAQQRALAAGLALIVGGALGNVIDRLQHGFVIDFVHVHWGRAYFPAFNLADSAITVGAALLLLDAWQEWRRERAAARGAGP